MFIELEYANAVGTNGIEINLPVNAGNIDGANQAAVTSDLHINGSSALASDTVCGLIGKNGDSVKLVKSNSTSNLNGARVRYDNMGAATIRLSITYITASLI